MDYIVHGVTKSQIQLNDFHFLHFLGVWNLREEMTAKMWPYAGCGPRLLIMKAFTTLALIES